METNGLQNQGAAERFITIRHILDKEALLQQIGYRTIQMLRDKVIRVPVASRCELYEGVFRSVLANREELFRSPQLRFFRIIAVLDVISMNLEESTTMTLRDLYYLLKNLFPSQDSCAHTVNQASMLLGVTRASLRILGCSRGVVKGALEYFYEGKWESTGAGVSIPQTCEAQACIRTAQGAEPPAFILVVEKHAVFHSLAAAEFDLRYNCVIITGKGVPDLPTRAFLKQLSQKFTVPIYGICDFNPFGIRLMLNYTWGSQGAAEAYLYTVPLNILGIGCEETTELPISDSSWQDASDLDLQECDRLLSLVEPYADAPGYLTSGEYTYRLLQWMKTVRVKLELEALNRLTRSPKPRWFQDPTKVSQNASNLAPDCQGAYLATVWLPSILHQRAGVE